MFDLFDPFGTKKRKREEMERVIAPYVRPEDDELTKQAIHLALTNDNFPKLGFCVLTDMLGVQRHVAAGLLLKLRDRGISSAAQVCEDLEITEKDTEEEPEGSAAAEAELYLHLLRESHKNR